MMLRIYGCTTLVKAGSILTSRKSENLPTETIFRTSSTSPNDITCQEVLASEKYWGQPITHTKTPSPIFSRLITAILAYFDATSTGVLQPSEFCTLMFAAGYSAEQFPPSIVSMIETTSPADLHELDAWLTNWFWSFPLNHRIGTRGVPPTTTARAGQRPHSYAGSIPPCIDIPTGSGSPRRATDAVTTRPRAVLHLPDATRPRESMCPP
ncbi:hypothetical protein BFJ69_g16551 [Fusarium oxysporum]|uniref:EF-hand domain-containing protein n=1 Tax=Fusarium oxysporum TaxID=5507 RepID=A0A420MAW1_FUSOX|nr:hypothetical protein BFJ69_g16551 [Fusarium oxysporum]